MDRAEFQEALLSVMEKKTHWAWPLFGDGKVPRDRLHLHLEHEYAVYVRDFPIEQLPHERIISTVDETSKQFHVLVLKTNMAIPYTSVFIRLDCKYWSADAEARMRAKMNASEPVAK
jgi:hypothetical protein